MYISPNLFKVYFNDMIVAVEAAKHGVTMRDDTVSGLFADVFVGISETPEGLQNQMKALLIEYTRKWRVTANVKKCAVVLCNTDKVNPVNFKWK